MTTIVGAAILLCTAVFGCYAPVRWLVPAVVVSFAVIPAKLAFALSMHWVFPGLVLVSMWAVRRGFSFGGPKSTTFAITARCMSALLMYYLLGVLLYYGLDDSQLVWAISFFVCFLLAIFVQMPEEDVTQLIRSWAYTGALAGLFCTLESILSFVPLYATLYAALGIESVQHWSSYRSEGSFGHPLYAGTFLAVGAVCSVGLLIRDRSWIYLILASLCSIGVAVTVSRGAFIALGAGAALSVVATFARSTGRRAVNLGVWALFVSGALVLVLRGGVLERSESEEGEGSAFVRDQVYEAAARVVSSNNGLGAGLASSAKAISQYNPVGYPLESSYWQLMVSIGVPGVVLLGLALLFALMAGLRTNESFVIAPMLLAFCVSLASYNAIETLTPQHALLGLLVAACLSADTYPKRIHNNAGAAQNDALSATH